MKMRSYEETMLRRKHSYGIAASVILFSTTVLGITGYYQWFYALGLLGLSLLSAYLFYSAKTISRANIFHALRTIFGSLFAAYVLVQLIFLFI